MGYNGALALAESSHLNSLLRLDLRNRDAAARHIDIDFEQQMRAKRSALTADRQLQIDQFLALGGVRAMWRFELRMLAEEETRRAALDIHPYFRLAAQHVADANNRPWDGTSGSDGAAEFNYDGFYGDPALELDAQANPRTFCPILSIIPHISDVACAITLGEFDAPVNPGCWLAVGANFAAFFCRVYNNEWNG